MSSPKMQALVQRGDKLCKESIEVPTPSDHQVLVKISYVAQNPTDIQAFDTKALGDGAVLGCDFVGSVEKIGSKVTRLKKGQVIAGLIWGGEIHGLGGFAEYTVADENICFPVPNSVGLAEASTIPLAACTAWLALFSDRCLAVDRHVLSGQSVLIYGGSSSVGLYAVQIAALYGLNVVALCSPKNHGNVMNHGANHVFDYRDPQVVQKIQAVAPDLEYVFDTIGNEKSSVLGSQAIKESGGTLCTVRPGKTFCENVTKQTKVTDVLVWTAFLKEHRYGALYWPPIENDNRLAIEFFEKVPAWLVEGRIRPNNPKIYEHGLDDVHKGFQEYRDGLISNYKIVYKL